ncbi:uncharacterized protein [Amphiura filiformis]|uniref:uncharacterized protein n=1 Tax=Amphiura filiformis TaxID=82378 RepID=UPI003B2126ED
MYGLGQSPPMLPIPHPAAVPGGPMNPSYPTNSLPGYPAGTAPTGEQGYSSAMTASQAAAYASNATSPRGTPPTIGFSPSVYQQNAAAAAAYGYGAPTYHSSSSYPYSAALSSASSQSPYTGYSQTAVPTSLSYQQAAAVQQAQQAGMMTPMMMQGVPRTVYVTDTRVSPALHGHPQAQGIRKPTISTSAGLMSTSPHAAAAAAAAQAAYYQQPGWQQQQAAVVAQQQQQAAAAQQPHRSYNPNPYAPHW